MRFGSRCLPIAAFAAAGFAGILGASPAKAQGLLICPAAIPGQTGFRLENGACTNGNTGAFSGAALASQALSDLTQSATQEAVGSTVNAVAARREEEAQRCSAGFTRVDGTCRPIAARPPRAAPTPPPVRAVRPRPAPRVATRSRPAPPVAARPQLAPRIVRKDAPAEAEPVLVAPPMLAPRFGAWAHAFGDYERREAHGVATINCCTGPVAGGIPIPLALRVESRTTSGGFVGGVDVTTRGLLGAGDGLVAGVLTGYLSSDLNLRTRSISGDPANVGNGFGRLKAQLSGPSAGAFLTYFNGPFSTDVTLKADFLDLDETFDDQLAFTANLVGGVPLPPAVVAFAGRGSTRLTNTTFVGNVNYRVPLSEWLWIEPTAGLQYTWIDYATSAAQLGLDDGHVLRIQGGARFGSTVVLGERLRMTTTVTTLAYSNVEISGGFIQGAGFGTNDLLTRADEGKLRGQAIVALNFDLGNGVTSFVQGDIRGGENFFGAGARTGLRVQW